MGESIGIGANSDKKEIAWDFLTWFFNPDIQLSWSHAGGQPGGVSVQDMSAYFLAKPYNFCFPTSLRIAIDPWRFSNANAITDIYSLYVNQAVFKRTSPEVALQNAAVEINAYLE
jgi:ABC-type glycerol-3-phosphate transport system substrate-binding protein